MTFDQAYDYLLAKNVAIRVHDFEDSYRTGRSQFIDKKAYKPAHEPFPLGTLLTHSGSK
jgi:trans-feruloyl-CoA hydratase/vanillin synthase